MFSTSMLGSATDLGRIQSSGDGGMGDLICQPELDLHLSRRADCSSVTVSVSREPHPRAWNGWKDALTSVIDGDSARCAPQQKASLCCLAARGPGGVGGSAMDARCLRACSTAATRRPSQVSTPAGCKRGRWCCPRLADLRSGPAAPSEWQNTARAGDQHPSSFRRWPSTGARHDKTAAPLLCLRASILCAWAGGGA